MKNIDKNLTYISKFVMLAKQNFSKSSNQKRRFVENKKRLPLETFDLPIHKIRCGYYSAVYFWRAKQILEKTVYEKSVTMQVFQKKKAVLCGMDEAIAVLKLCSGYYTDQAKALRIFGDYLKVARNIRKLSINLVDNIFLLEIALAEKLGLEQELDLLWQPCAGDLTIRSLFDGDLITFWETVMTIEGWPQYFVHLESVYLGILARRTMVATNVRRVKEAAQGKPIFFFADRFDYYENQTGDGYAAAVGGVSAVATDMMGEWCGSKGSGTMPHALIASFERDTVAATIAFAKAYPQVPCVSLVDFKNNCVDTALKVAEAMKAEGLALWGVRLDTSENMVDESLANLGGTLDRFSGPKSLALSGVNPILVSMVRKSLDQHGYQDVKIVVSGGFTAEKIEHFEMCGVPVDVYGCGSSLLKGDNDFTADIVMVDGQPCAKTGRKYLPNPRLSLME